jgi:hypothetical protein
MLAVIQPLTGAVRSRCRPALASLAGWRCCRACNRDICGGQVGDSGSGKHCWDAIQISHLHARSKHVHVVMPQHQDARSNTASCCQHPGCQT